MNGWTDQCASLLLVPGVTLERARQGAAELIAKLGFEYCGYTLETILPLSAPRSLFLTNLDGALLACVEQHRARAVLPAAIHVRRSSALLLWPPDAPSTDLFWPDMRRLGVRCGWTLTAAERGLAIGRFTALRTSAGLGPHEARTALPHWAALTNTMDQAVRRLVHQDLLSDTGITLTRAELDVLVWAGDGKTAWETAQILNVSLRHVAYLRARAITKLGGNNIIDSVVKALTLGLLIRPVEPL